MRRQEKTGHHSVKLTSIEQREISHGDFSLFHFGQVEVDDIQIQDERGQEVPRGDVGEICARGDNIMLGYWNLPDVTEETLRDGWLHTGDLAAMDGDGYFRICGRLKEMIVCSGYNVYPDEIDRVLTEHPDVLECATIGVPDEKRGETVKSFVVRKEGAAVTPEALTEHCRANLAPFKIPREIEFRDELPKSSVLKILRRELVEQELAKRGK